MVNEHHATATCMSAAAVVPLAVLARITQQARLLVLGYPIANRPDPVRVAEELATIDVISRGRLEMGFVKGVPPEVPVANLNPVFQMERFWEAHDLILKAMTTHDGPFNWEGEHFHYRHVNIWATSLSATTPAGVGDDRHTIDCAGAGSTGLCVGDARYRVSDQVSVRCIPTDLRGARTICAWP